MREIKFRAWNKEENIMCYENEDFEADYWDGHYASLLETINDSLKTDKYIFMQYVGLHDKNGKEIYEGDVVKIDCPTMKMTGEIKYSEMSAMFYIYDVIEDIEETLWYQKEEYEIIGNIYENPELLEHK